GGVEIVAGVDAHARAILVVGAGDRVVKQAPARGARGVDVADAGRQPGLDPRRAGELHLVPVVIDEGGIEQELSVGARYVADGVPDAVGVVVLELVGELAVDEVQAQRRARRDLARDAQRRFPGARDLQRLLAGVAVFVESGGAAGTPHGVPRYAAGERAGAV